MASSFSGDGAEKQAKELVFELRSATNCRPTRTVAISIWARRTDGASTSSAMRRKFKYAKQDKSHVELDEVAVLVGDFGSVDDPDAQKTLKNLKLAEPECLQIKEGQATHQTLTGWRMLQRQVYETMVGKKKKRARWGTRSSRGIRC